MSIPSSLSQEIPQRLLQYKPGDWTTFPVTRFMTSVAVSPSMVYFGSTHGISCYNSFQDCWEGCFTVSDGLDDQYVRAVAYDETVDLLWCATRKGLNFFRWGSQQWLNLAYDAIPVNGADAIGSGTRWLWIRSGSGYFRSDKRSWIFTHAGENEANEDAIRWAVTTPERLPGSLLMETGYQWFGNRILASGLREVLITASAPDSFGNCWIGSWGLGAIRADIRFREGTILSYGLWAESADAIALDENGLWTAGLQEQEGGITFWDWERDDWLYFESFTRSGLSSHKVSQILLDGGKVWFATDAGLAVFEKESDTWRTYTSYDNLWSDRILALARTGQEIWIGTDRGLNRIASTSMIVETMRIKDLSFVPIYYLEYDGQTLWAGSSRGIFSYRRSDGWTAVKGYAGMLVYDVFSISAWRNEVWFATDDGVEWVDTKTGVWSGFPREQFFPQTKLNTILADSNTVWVGTMNGLYKYLKSEDRWRRFSVLDGLPDDRIKMILLDGDFLWIGTKSGLVRLLWNAPYRID